MNEINKDFGKLNPNAPSALSRFAFLIGRWRCEAKVKLANGVSQTFPATWVGRYILDGYAIADEYRMTGSSGELIVLGLNFRVYDATKQIWKIKWLNALDGTWWDLGPEGSVESGSMASPSPTPSGSPRARALISASLTLVFLRRILRGGVRNLTTATRGANSWLLRPIGARSRRSIAMDCPVGKWPTSVTSSRQVFTSRVVWNQPA